MTSRMRLAVSVLGLAAVFAALPGVATAAPSTSARTPASAYPDIIPLPAGFRPEGIAIGRAPFAYFGSLANGAIYRASLATGQGAVISPSPGAGQQAVGLKLDDRGRLFVAGGGGGNARVVDARSGAVLATYQFSTTTPTFINDVVLTPGAAWFTDSQQPALYRLPLGRRGALPGPTGFVRVPLVGEWAQIAGNNANGISRTPDGRALLVVQSATGFLFRVDPATGVATRVNLGAETLLTNGDGLLLRGRTLFVVQNRLNRIAVISLNRAGTAGTVAAHLTSPNFDVPTTVAAYRGRLYLPNARFTTPPTPETTYTAVSVPLP
ncbi:MAG TPA: superoxide dismutase [Pilimelia sp.]|nr:superoxide dismutase [Pilimelia sp.]